MTQSSSCRIVAGLLSQGKEGTDDEGPLAQHTQCLLVKDGGVRWISTCDMLYRAIQLETIITPVSEALSTYTQSSPCPPSVKEYFTGQEAHNERSKLSLGNHY